MRQVARAPRAPEPVDSSPAVVPGEVRRGHLRVLRGSAEA